MNWESVKGIVERLLFLAAAFAVGRGWIAESDAAGYVALALGILSAIVGWYVNRPTALLDAAAKSVPQAARLELVPLPGESKAVAEIASRAIQKVVAAPVFVPGAKVPNPNQSKG